MVLFFCPIHVDHVHVNHTSTSQALLISVGHIVVCRSLRIGASVPRRA
jgi:hypothetical protein